MVLRDRQSFLDVIVTGCSVRLSGKSAAAMLALRGYPLRTDLNSGGFEQYNVRHSQLCITRVT
ncbi:hypothetical protein LY39_02650 [Roseinatronobacter bogoriensis subsp. barguzinensis]|nr:hypothetical protein [Rhodobaca bogoriensis DSM 18756]TDW37557.1 hypothetical protein LY39_02650 [Rhodobaca barguzinensis]TDY68167.1 hypothetical protein EV660_10671 [Rhodobaca bogoriensis DSM 18756]